MKTRRLSGKTPIVLIGPLPPPLGGATVLFKSFVDACARRRDGIFDVVATTTGQRSRFSLACEFVHVLVSGRVRLVSVHMSSTSGVKVGPLLALVCFIFFKKFVFRGFGGNFDVAYRRLTFLQAALFRLMLRRSAFCLFETRASVDYFKELAPAARVLQLPNYRSLSLPDVGSLVRRPGNGKLRVVFVGRVCREKGVELISEAAEALGGLVEATLFGPLEKGFDLESLSPHVRYQGVLAPENVTSVIASYDCLVLPTFWDGEGHPGVILEAYAAGIPVISTEWRAIPEIFPEGGLLVEPGNVGELVATLLDLLRGSVDVQGLVEKQFEMLKLHDQAIWEERLRAWHVDVLNRG